MEELERGTKRQGNINLKQVVHIFIHLYNNISVVLMMDNIKHGSSLMIFIQHRTTKSRIRITEMFHSGDFHSVRSNSSAAILFI